ncbi:V-type ATP synthase subunit B, partial [Nocardia gipuzkoensis]
SPGGDRRHGIVLEVCDDLAVVEVLEGSRGLDPATTVTEFTGAPFDIAVGTGWLGRVCNGRGVPLDGGPPVMGPRVAVSGAPLNPMRREPPADPVLTGVSVIDALTTLVRGQKLPVFSLPGLPHLQLACQIADQSNTAGEPFCVVVATMGITHADAAYVREHLAERGAAEELVLLL